MLKEPNISDENSNFNGSKLANYAGNLHTFWTLNRFPEYNFKHVSMGYKTHFATLKFKHFEKSAG